MSSRTLLRRTLGPLLVAAGLLMLGARLLGSDAPPSIAVGQGLDPGAESYARRAVQHGTDRAGGANAADTSNMGARRPGAVDPAVAAAMTDDAGQVPVIVHLRAARGVAFDDELSPARFGRSTLGGSAASAAPDAFYAGDARPSSANGKSSAGRAIDAAKSAFDAELASLEPSLDQLEATGHVGSRRPLWLAQAVAVDADSMALRALARHPSVRLLTLDRTVAQEPWDPIGRSDRPGVPGDGDDSLWNIRMVRADHVWQRLGYDGQGVTVGILDSGVDYHHRALTTRYRGHVGGPQPSNVGNWWCKASDFLCGENPLYPVDGVGHGTHVVGSAVAPLGVGVAPGASWIAARVCTRSDACWLSWILEALQWMVDGDPSQRADVVNVSLSLYDSPAMRDAFAALERAGITVVAASGNDKTVVRSPAIYPEVIAVGAVTASGTMWENSSHGNTSDGKIKPDIVAPGEFITSTVPGGGWARATGTSMASPHVAGAVALLLQAEPDLTPREVQSVLRDTAVPLSSTKPHPVSGWGLLNAYGAVLSVTDSGRVAGRVFDALDQTPIPWAEIDVTTDAGVPVTRAKADDGGNYVIDLAPGDYLVRYSAFTYRDTTREASVRLDTTVSLDVGLEVVSDVGFYVGTVTDAESGVGIQGSINIRGVPERFTIPVDRYAGFSQRMPPGTYEISIAEFGYRVLTGTVRIDPGVTTEHNYKLQPTPRILLVDGDAWAYSAALDYYRGSLGRLGYVHHEWRVTVEDAGPGEPGGPPAESDLAAYDLVIWSSSITGPTFVEGAGPIAAYLASGGRMILSGQDALCTDASSANASDPCNLKARPHPYVHDQLHLRVLSDNAKAFAVHGVDGGPLDGLDLSLNGPQSMDNQMMPDVIEVLSPLNTSVIGTYPDGSGAAALVDTCEPHRAAVLAFGFEGVSDASTRDELLARLIDAIAAEAPEAGLHVQLDSDELVVPPGATAEFTVTLHSTGTKPTNVDVEVLASDWDASLWSSGFQGPLQRPVALARCQAVPVGVRVQVPESAQRGAFVTTTLRVADPSAELSSTVALVTRATAPLLLVDGDFGRDTEARYIEALRQAGVAFDTWELGLMATDPVLPTDEDLARYPMVVWFTGDDWRPNGTLSLETQAMLARYLDNGGRLYFTSEDYLSIRGGAPFDGERFFHIEYLGTHDYHPDAGAAHGSPLRGASDSLLADLAACRLEWKPPQEDFSDRLVPASLRARATLLNSVGLPVAVQTTTSAFRSLFLAFDAGELEQPCANAVMARAIDWFSPLNPSRLTMLPEGQLTYASGDTLRLRLDVLNGSLEDIDNVTVEWRFPAGGSVDTGSIPAEWTWDAATRSIGWTGSLAASERLSPVPEVRFVLDDVLPEDTTMASVARAVGDSVPVVREVVWRVNAPDLRTSSKSVPDDQRHLDVGQAATFAVNVRNTGTRSAEQFVVTDTLPAGLVLLPDTVSSGGGGSIDLDTIPNGLVWRGSVDPGRTTSLTYGARVDTHRGGWLRNAAVLNDGHGYELPFEASVFARPWLLLPWLGREVDPDP